MELQRLSSIPKFGAINAIISALYAIFVAGILGTFIAYLSA
ncbi:hypothetical protein [Cytobacillus sp. BC1816]